MSDMRIFCRKAIRHYNEFPDFIANAKRRYPSYTFGGADEFSMQGWLSQLQDYVPIGFYIIENYEGVNYMGFYRGNTDLDSTRFFRGAECVTRHELDDIFASKNNYTFRSKRANAHFTLELAIDLAERPYA